MSIADSFKSLGKVDFAELELNNIGSWPAAVRVLACLIVLTAVLALGYFMHLTDLRDALDRQQTEEVSLKEQFTAKVRQAANVSSNNYCWKVVLCTMNFQKEPTSFSLATGHKIMQIAAKF